MSKPANKDIALVLGISASQVSQLANRGMPIKKIKLAKDWYEKNGFTRVGGKRGGKS